MRASTSKSHARQGWKGYINDPYMDDSFRVDVGMEKARDFLLKINELGLPTGTEALDPISPQYYGDLIAWTAIGARTTESQTHREMSSGLSTPLASRTAPAAIWLAVNAILSARPSPTPFSASMAKAASPSSAPAEIATDTSSCAGDSRPN